MRGGAGYGTTLPPGAPTSGLEFMNIDCAPCKPACAACCILHALFGSNRVGNRLPHGPPVTCGVCPCRLRKLYAACMKAPQQTGKRVLMTLRRLLCLLSAASLSDCLQHVQGGTALVLPACLLPVAAMRTWCICAKQHLIHHMQGMQAHPLADTSLHSQSMPVPLPVPRMLTS